MKVLSYYRSHSCGELKEKNIGEKVKLAGWVNKIRKFGKINFIEIRDRYGITQLIIDDDMLSKNIIKNEYVIRAEGFVRQRKQQNLKIPTGKIEVIIENITILSKAKPTPFSISDKINALEETRFKYRYLDFRAKSVSEIFQFKSKLKHALSSYLNKNGFIELSTPILTKSTPEGSRDFLVPSRLDVGNFYALPQSPQMFKQLFMVGGFDKYFQFATAFRDEDYRSDRQPEFLQLDIEMSFVKEIDVISFCEQMIKESLSKIMPIKFDSNFPILSFDEAIAKYGSDKPDTRFGLEINDITKINDIKKHTIDKYNLNESIRLYAIFTDFNVSRKNFEKLQLILNQFKANHEGIATPYLEKITIKNDEILSKLKLSSDSLIYDIKSKFMLDQEIKDGNLLFIAGEFMVCHEVLGAIRTKLNEIYNLADENKFNFLWINNWPLFEFSDIENRYISAHHPFTSPAENSIHNFDKNLKDAKAQAYDLVLNGYEVGGGSIRIHDHNIQERMFKALNFTSQQIINNFGFFVDALDYGTPPHGGIAIGFDRLVMVLLKRNSLREVIEFPKSTTGVSFLSQAPTKITKSQLDELSLKIIEKKEE